MNGCVVGRRGSYQGHRRNKLKDLVVVKAIVENAEACSYRGFAISEYIPGKPNARSDLNGRDVHDALFVLPHPLIRRTRSRGKRADFYGGEKGSGDRIASHTCTGSRINVGLNERRLGGAIVCVYIKGSQSISGAQGRLNEIKADTGIDGKPSGNFPGVLRIPLHVDIARVGVRMSIRFRVAIDNTQ